MEGSKMHAPISRRKLLKAGGKVAVGVAAAGALTGVPGVPAALANNVRAGTTTLNYLTGLTGGDGDVMAGLVKQFNKEHSNITVKMQSLQWVNFFPKLNSSLAGGNAPDVFTIHIQEMLYYQDKGLFGNLDDLFGSSLPTSDFSSLPMKYVQSKGHITGMPLDMHGFALYLNPDLFKKAGLPTRSPNSHEELVQWARMMTLDSKGNNALSKNFNAGAVKQYGLSVEWDIPTYLATLWSLGGNTISADGKQATLNTPQARDALNFWTDLIYKYHAVNKPLNYGTTGSSTAFFNGALAMMPNGNWERDLFRLHPRAKQMAVFMPPFGSKRVTWMSGHVIATPTGLSGAKKDAVYTFMRWLSNHGTQWSQGAGHIPARTSQRQGAGVTSLWPQRVFAQELPEIGRIEQPNTAFFDIQGAWDPNIQAALNGSKSPTQALADAQSRITRAIANSRG